MMLSAVCRGSRLGVACVHLHCMIVATSGGFPLNRVVRVQHDRRISTDTVAVAQCLLPDSSEQRDAATARRRSIQPASALHSSRPIPVRTPRKPLAHAVCKRCLSWRISVPSLPPQLIGFCEKVRSRHRLHSDFPTRKALPEVPRTDAVHMDTHAYVVVGRSLRNFMKDAKRNQSISENVGAEKIAAVIVRSMHRAKTIHVGDRIRKIRLCDVHPEKFQSAPFSPVENGRVRGQRGIPRIRVDRSTYKRHRSVMPNGWLIRT